MNPIFLDLGIVTIYWYSVFIFIALLIGGTLAIKEARKWKIPEDFMINYFFFLVPIVLIGARIYYVIFEWSYYSQNIVDIFKIWEGGLAIHGGIIAGIIWTIIYSFKYKVSFFRLSDIMVVSLILGQAIGRWGNFFNGEAYGPATTLEALSKLHLPKFIIDGMFIDGTYYTPTFLYESILCLIGFIVLLIIRKNKYIKVGNITAIYFIWYGVIRFFIEGLRTDSLMLGNFKMAQIVSIIMVVFGILQLIFSKKGSVFKNRYNDIENTKSVDF